MRHRNSFSTSDFSNLFIYLFCLFFKGWLSSLFICEHACQYMFLSEWGYVSWFCEGHQGKHMKGKTAFELLSGDKSGESVCVGVCGCVWSVTMEQPFAVPNSGSQWETFVKCHALTDLLSMFGFLSHLTFPLKFTMESTHFIASHAAVHFSCTVKESFIQKLNLHFLSSLSINYKPKLIV